MNIPLNIDFQQILLHLFNFGILAGGLWLLLYKPVKKFMEKREAEYREQQAKAEQLVTYAEELRDEYSIRLSDADDEIKRRSAEAAKEAEDAARETIQDAKNTAEKIIDEARRQASEEREKIIDDAEKEVVQIASEAVRKLLLKQDEAFDSFVEGLNNGNQDE